MKIIQKTARIIGYGFLTLLLMCVLLLGSWFIWFVTSELLAPRKYEYLDYNEMTWLQQHHSHIGLAAGIIFIVGFVCSVYTFFRDVKEDDSGCPKSCSCPQHPWNQDHTDLMTGTSVGTAIGS